MTESDIATEGIPETNGLPDKKIPKGEWPSGRRKKRSTHGYDPLSDDTLAAAREDYLTGEYHSVDLAEKYGGKRLQYAWHIRHNWKRELEPGITPPEEPPFETHHRSADFWQQVQVDYLRGAGETVICKRYDLHPGTLAKKIANEKWGGDRQKMILAAKDQISTALILRGRELEGRFAEFMDVATKQLQSFMRRMKKFEDEKVEMSPEEFNLMVKTYASLCDSGRKLYQVDGSTGQVGFQNGASSQKGPIRINVMEGAKLQIGSNDPAPVLNVT